MSLTLSGSGTVTGLTAGGLPDATVTSADIANANVTQSKLAAGVAGNGPAFSATGSGTQTISNTTWTKCAVNIERYDTASCYDNSTNYRFTPNVAGYYQVNAQAYVYPGGGAVYSGIYKNGSQYVNIAVPNGSQGPSVMISTQVYMNGSTDYLELYVYQSSGGSLLGGVQDFNACLLRAA